MSTPQKSIEVFKRYFVNQRGNAKSTLKGYLGVIKDFQKFAEKKNLDFGEVNEDAFLGYVTRLKTRLKPQSVSRYVTTLKSFYEILQVKGLVAKSPVKDIKIKSHQSPKDILTDIEIEQLLSIAKNNYENKGVLYNSARKGKHLPEIRSLRDYLLIKILAETGLRISELLHIRPVDLDFGQDRVKVLGKGQKCRIQPISNEIKALLTTYLDRINPSGRIFDLTTQGSTNIIKFFLEKAGICKQISPHSFRHYFITRCHRQGINLITIQNLVGHVSLSTTSRYTHPSIDTLQTEYNKIQN